MQLGGRVNEEQALAAGKYTKANELSSGRPYWMHSDGTYALWFTQGSWRMGKKSNLGTQTSGIKSTNSPLCPEYVGTNWKYGDGEEWLDAQGNAKVFKYKGMIHQVKKPNFLMAKNSFTLFN